MIREPLRAQYRLGRPGPQCGHNICQHRPLSDSRPYRPGRHGIALPGRDPQLDRLIAIKLLRDDNDELRERFVREARSAGRLSHGNIVTIFDVGEHNGQPFIAMEYIQGETLAELIRRRAPLPLLRPSCIIIEELCAGLAFAHSAGIVHRDVKPANIMIEHEAR